MAKTVQINVDQGDVRRIGRWLEAIGRSPFKLWKEVKPIMQKEIEREFSDENPNQWKALSPKYLDWKVSEGYPATIGVRTGLLKQAATTRAIVIERETYLIWSINESLAAGTEEPDYFSSFNSKRRIFKHTERYMNQAYRDTANKWINDQINAGAK